MPIRKLTNSNELELLLAGIRENSDIAHHLIRLNEEVMALPSSLKGGIRAMPEPAID